jgi:anhydro-N-acetylmuramic acid kinase
LGGFANISFKQNGKRLAFDICPCNILLNAVAQQIGFAYDENGQLAATGKINTALLDTLNGILYYQQLGAKSLSREWVEKEIWPLVTSFTLTHEDLLATFTEHIALQLSTTFNRVAGTNMLITGGGAFNSFLVNRLRSLTKQELILPPSNLIEFKEALIFAFMGVLKLQHKTTALAEVTNAKFSSIGGCIYG